jgi:cobalt-zinc-cadmium efflux system protein
MGRVLVWSLAITVILIIVEAVAGFSAHSLALLSDAGHNFTDALSLLLAWFGVFYSRKPPDQSKTYGYHRAGVLAAFVNALALLLLSGFIIYESYERWMNPQPVAEMVMLGVAIFGLAVNAAVMMGLQSGRKRDINVRSAWAHMLGDALGSIGIIIGAVVIRYTGWVRTDAVLSGLIGLLIVWTAWDIIREALNILLEGLPRGIDLNDVTSAMRAVRGVLDVHDLHIWSLGSSTHALSCHVLIQDLPPSESAAILGRLNKMLERRFRIGHVTVQFENANCPGCPIPAGNHRHD